MKDSFFVVESELIFLNSCGTKFDRTSVELVLFVGARCDRPSPLPFKTPPPPPLTLSFKYKLLLFIWERVCKER